MYGSQVTDLTDICYKGGSVPSVKST